MPFLRTVDDAGGNGGVERENWHFPASASFPPSLDHDEQAPGSLSVLAPTGSELLLSHGEDALPGSSAEALLFPPPPGRVKASFFSGGRGEKGERTTLPRWGR